MPFSTVFQSGQDNGRVIIKVCNGREVGKFSGTDSIQYQISSKTVYLRLERSLLFHLELILGCLLNVLQNSCYYKAVTLSTVIQFTLFFVIAQ